MAAESSIESDPLIRMTVERLVDELSIHQTFFFDEDLLVRHKSSKDTTREKRNTISHVESIFGPKAADSTFLSAQLLACYRGEVAASTENGEYLAVKAMPDPQCRVFKKKMKRRIHEWEAAVRAETGDTDVRPNSKAAVRGLYELYRASKERIGHIPDSTTGSAVSNNAHGSEANRFSSQSEAAHGSSSHGDGSSSPQGAAASATSFLTRSNAASASHQDPAASLQESAPTEDDPQILNIINRLPHVRLGIVAPSEMSIADLNAEKHQIKQVLHRFENEVFLALGYRPPRNGPHRQRLSKVYNRYGSLKAELNARANNNALERNEETA